jgi:urease accessory protein
MLRATSVRPRDQIRAGEVAADSIALDHTARHRRRVVFTAAGGLQFLLDLEHARALRDGDGLVLEDGRLVVVNALPEPLLEVRARDARHLAALAWQIGNRHLEA